MDFCMSHKNGDVFIRKIIPIISATDGLLGYAVAMVDCVGRTAKIPRQLYENYEGVFGFVSSITGNDAILCSKQDFNVLAGNKAFTFDETASCFRRKK